MARLSHLLLAFGLLLVQLGCNTEHTTSGDQANSSNFSPRPETCDESTPPVVMVHGFIGAGDTWTNFKDLFVANGKCGDRYAVLDWNSLDMEGDHAEQLERLIDELLSTYEVSQVDLMGHSAGGGVSYAFLENPTRARKIRKYVHIGSFAMPPPMTVKEQGIEMLNLYSDGDYVVMGDEIEGATNRRLEDTDHYAVATSDESFGIVFEFLYDQRPMVFERPVFELPKISGRAVSLGEATLLKQSTVRAHRLDAVGQRTGKHEAFIVDEMGWWGPLSAGSGDRFELELRLDGTDNTFRYFFEPFESDNSLIYLRSLPGEGSTVGLILYEVPQDGDDVSLVVFNASGAFLTGRDSLTLDGRELLTEDNASADQTTIALFIFDIDGDGKAGGRSALFDTFPFLTAVDIPLAAMPQTSFTLDFNGRQLTLPRDPASTGPLIAIFR